MDNLQADEFYSVCREQDGYLSVEQVRAWHDAISALGADNASLRKRLEELVAVGPPEDSEYGLWGCCEAGYRKWLHNEHAEDCPWVLAKAALAALEEHDG